MPLSPETTASICLSYRLTPLTLTDINYKLYPPFGLLFHFKIIVSTTGYTCITPTGTLTQASCTAILLKHLPPKAPFTYELTLRTELLTKYKNQIVYVASNGESYFFTTSTVIGSACLGDIQPKATHTKNVHDLFFKKLNTVYLNLIDFLDTTFSHLVDTLFSITTEDQITTFPIPSDIV